MLRGKGKSLLRTKRSVERAPLRRRLPLWRFPAVSGHGNGHHGLFRRLRRKTPGARRLQYIGRVNGRPLRTFRPMEGEAPVPTSVLALCANANFCVRRRHRGERAGFAHGQRQAAPIRPVVSISDASPCAAVSHPSGTSPPDFTYVPPRPTTLRRHEKRATQAPPSRRNRDHRPHVVRPGDF